MSERFARHVPIASPGVVSPFALRVLSGPTHSIVRVTHRATLSGTEHLPEGEPFLLVANHPPSLGLAEFTSFAALYAKRFGRSRPLAGFAHAASFGWWPLSLVMRHIGAVPSTYDAAERALEARVPLVILPGGDHEGFRPFWQADRVDFCGRVGFLRIAHKAWVPVVPMGFHGVTAPLLLRSRMLAYLFVWPRLAGVKRFGLSLLALLGAATILAFVPVAWPWRVLLAWAWAASPLALVSCLPTRITIRIGPPLAPEELFGERAEGPADDATLKQALAKVEAAVQALVTPTAA